VSAQDLGQYGVMILSKHPCWFFDHRYKSSRMGRTLLVAEPINGINGHNILVANSHFESLNEPVERKIQMETAFDRLKRGKEVILCGDFNFDNSWKHESEVFQNNNYVDTFNKFVPEHGQDSFTMFKSPRYSAWRPDKILYRSVNADKQNSSIEPIDGFIGGKFTTPYFVGLN